MKRASSRLIPTAARPLRPTSLRPVISLTPLPSTPSYPHAGPSSQSSRFFTSSTIQSYPAKDPTNATQTSDATQTTQAVNEDNFEDGLEVTEEDLQAAEDALDLALSDAEYQFHQTPSTPLDPIIFPLSSFANLDPTIPDPSGMAIALPRELFSERTRRDILHRCVVWYRSTMRQGTHKTKGRSELAFSNKKLRPQKGSGRARLGDATSPHLRKGADAHPKRPRNYAQLLPRKVRALGMRIALSTKLDMGLLRVVTNLNDGQWTKTKEAVTALSNDFVWQSAESEVGETSEQTQPEAMGATAIEGSEPNQSPSVIDGIEEMANDSMSSAEVAAETEVAEGEWVKKGGFGPAKDLSILFVYPPEKPVEEVAACAKPLRNIPNVEIMSTNEVSVYHILKYKWLILEGGAVDALSLHKGQPRLEEGQQEWEDVDEASLTEGNEAEMDLATVEDGNGLVPVEGKESIEVEVHDHPVNPGQMPTWLKHTWRKEKGAKSMRKTFGMKNATAIENESKQTWRKIAEHGVRPTPTLVNIAMASKHSWKDRSTQRIIP